MTTMEKIVCAENRIKELELLIESWKDSLEQKKNLNLKLQDNNSFKYKNSFAA